MKKQLLILLIFVFFSYGFETVRHAPPDDESEQASVEGMKDIRVFAGKPNTMLINDLASIMEKNESNGVMFFDQSSKTYNLLAISGGAGNGAYGAGLLNGWSQSGSRPVFDLVTGVSAGAIIAPFAFVGSKYDSKLKTFFTQYSTKDILHKKGLLPILLSDSIASSLPLKRLIEKNIDKQLIKDVAQGYRQGRRLYIGTTDLDLRRFVIWDMGKIASYDNEKALKLFRRVILASSSIPAIFPPVYINVEVGNKVYNEMHVDGGISKDVFFIYDVAEGLDKKVKVEGIDIKKSKRKLYVILNGYTKTFPNEVPDTLSGVAGQSFDLLATNKAIGDIYELYNLSLDRGADFNLAFIPSVCPPKQREFFDPIEARRLFALGQTQALKGYPWRKIPPGLDK